METGNAKISSLENRLSGILKPVAPRREFIHSLGKRIQGNTTSVISRMTDWHVLAMLIAGFVSLAVLLAMAVRAVLALAEKKRTA